MDGAWLTFELARVISGEGESGQPVQDILQRPLEERASDLRRIFQEHDGSLHIQSNQGTKHRSPAIVQQTRAKLGRVRTCVGSITSPTFD